MEFLTRHEISKFVQSESALREDSNPTFGIVKILNNFYKLLPTYLPEKNKKRTIGAETN